MHTRWWWWWNESSSLVGHPVLPGPSDLVFLKLADGRGWAQSLSFQRSVFLSFTNKNLCFVGSFRPSTEVQMWEHSVYRHELKDVVIPWSSPGHPRGNPRGIPRDRCQPRRPARKDRLAPYRLPEGVRLPGKIRQDQAMGSRVCVVFFCWPEEESFADWLKKKVIELVCSATLSCEFMWFLGWCILMGY